MSAVSVLCQQDGWYLYTINVFQKRKVQHSILWFLWKQAPTLLHSKCGTSCGPGYPYISLLFCVADVQIRSRTVRCTRGGEAASTRAAPRPRTRTTDRNRKRWRGEGAVGEESCFSSWPSPSTTSQVSPGAQGYSVDACVCILLGTGCFSYRVRCNPQMENEGPLGRKYRRVIQINKL